jgi:hypothetical protein
MLFEFDRIIGKDRIEIFLGVPRKLEIVLVRVFRLLALPLHELSLALDPSLLYLEEVIVLKEVKNDW